MGKQKFQIEILLLNVKLKSLDFKERKLKKIENLPLQDIAKIDQIIEYIF